MPVVPALASSPFLKVTSTTITYSDNVVFHAGSHDNVFAINAPIADAGRQAVDLNTDGNTRGFSVLHVPTGTENMPPGITHFLLGTTYSTAWADQFAVEPRTNRRYSRTNPGGTWGTWDEILMSRGGPLGLGRLESDASGNITSQGPGNVRVVQSQATFILNTSKIDIPGLSVTLTGTETKPETYKIEANVRTDSVVTQQVVVLRLFNVTDNVVLPDTEVLPRFDIGLTFTALQATTGLGTFITITEETTITVQGSSDLGTGASLNDGNGRSYLMAHRI